MPLPDEFEIIQSIKDMFPLLIKDTIGIGDDAAVFPGALASKFLITTDALTDGTHFLSDRIDFQDLGYKSMAVNISDLAAMGGEPLYVLLTLGLNTSIPYEKLESFFKGMNEIRKDFSFDLIGGDTVQSDTFFISVTMIGRPFKQPILRSTAKPGDRIYVSGTLGDSALGLDIILNKNGLYLQNRDYFVKRHYRPTPRTALAQYLTTHYNISSCIDLSDGLASDLGRICEESKVGSRIELETLPMSASEIGSEYMDNPKPYLEYAYSGGEDYELLFTTSDQLDTKAILKNTGVQINAVGQIEGSESNIYYQGMRLDNSNLKKGFKHF